MKRWRIIIRTVLVAFLVFIAGGLDCRLKIREYTIESEKVSQPFRFVLITDLHSCKYGKGEKNLVKKIDKFCPDAIFLCGDIYDDILPMNITTEFLKNIGARYRCYYTSGNHEVKSGNLDTIKYMVTDAGVTILERERATIANGKDSINICGVPDVTELITWRKVWEAVDSLSKDGNPKYYTILLNHRPELVEKFMESPYDLVLAGHYHGGQFRLPWMKEGVYAPDHAAQTKYTGGKYDFQGRHIIISRGLARESTRIPRFYIRPEMIEVTILPKTGITQKQ